MDDDASLRDVLIKGLTSETLVVEAAANGQTALERIDAGNIDLVDMGVHYIGTGIDLRFPHLLK